MSKQRKPLPDKSFEEHVTTKHHLRLGFQAGKDDKGELVLGVKGGVDNFRDRVVVVDENSKPNYENKIPKVVDLVNHSDLNKNETSDIPEEQ